MAAGTDLVPVSEYRALANPNRTLELIQAELQGQQLTEFNLTRVKMATGGGQFWQVPSITGVEAVPAIEGVVLLSKFSRSYWEAAFSGGNEPPDCSSPDAEHATSRPDIDIPAPADPDRDDPNAHLCNGCGYAAWGTKMNEKGEATRGQACKMSRVLFVLHPRRNLPMVVVLPPTSLKPAQNYFLGLADVDIDHKDLVTKIGLVKASGKGVPDYAQAAFEAGPEVPEDQRAFIRTYSETVRNAFATLRVEDRTGLGPDAA